MKVTIISRDDVCRCGHARVIHIPSGCLAGTESYESGDVCECLAFVLA